MIVEFKEDMQEGLPIRPALAKVSLLTRFGTGDLSWRLLRDAGVEIEARSGREADFHLFLSDLEDAIAEARTAR